MLLVLACLLLLTSSDTITHLRSEEVVNVGVDAQGDQIVEEEDIGVIPDHKSYSVSFINKRNTEVKLFWDPGDGKSLPVYQATIHPQSEQSINTYDGHKFFFATPENPTERLLEATMTYYDNSVILYPENMSKQDKEFENEREKFLKDYFTKNGYAWKNFYPRDQFVVYHMYKPTQLGEKFYVNSSVQHFIECPDENDNTLQYEEVTGRNYKQNGYKFCQLKSEEPITIEIETLCTRPKIFRVNNVLSDFESSHIVDIGTSIGLKRSTVTESALIDTGRTSSTAWIDRRKSLVVDKIFRRIADIVKIPEEDLYLHKSAESLQLVHYGVNEKYNTHYDYQTDQSNNRYITFLMYLNNVVSGGHTGFPKAEQECKDFLNITSKVFSINPGKNNAVFFYNLFEDGNVDDKTLHSGMPVKEGEKFMTNLWIWDHKFSRAKNNN